jgi:hypothetical protein
VAVDDDGDAVVEGSLIWTVVVRCTPNGRRWTVRDRMDVVDAMVHRDD